MMNSRMLTIVAVAILLVSISSGSSPRTEVDLGRRRVAHGGRLLWGEAGGAQAVVEGEARPQHVEQGGQLGIAVEVDRLARRQLGAVGGDGHVGLFVVDGGAGGGVVGHGTHAHSDAGRRAELLDPGDPARRVGPGHHDLLGVGAATAEVGEHDDRGEGDSADDQRDLEGGGSGGLGGSPAWRPATRGRSRPDISDLRWRLHGVLIGGAADEGEEHLGQAAAVERELVHRSRPPGGVEHHGGPLGGGAGAGAQRHPHTAVLDAK